MVDLFLNPTRVPQTVEQAIEIGVNTVWMQLGVIDDEAALKAKESGIQVVMDRCMPIRLPQNGELEYDPVHVRLPPDTVRVPETLP